MRFLEMHIEVEDLERSVEFYKRLLPHKRVLRFGTGRANALIMEDGTAFGLWKKGVPGLHGGRGAEHLHFAMQISPDEYDHYLGRLRELEAKVIEHDWEDGHRSIYFFDPDGHQGEFMTKDWLGSAAGPDPQGE